MASTVQSSDRQQLLEERQISRMILEIERSREQLSLLGKENAALRALVEKLDAQIVLLTALAESHKSAAQDREKALALKDRIEALYKESLDDANKRIERLKRSKRFWKKLTSAAAVAGVITGFLLAK